MSDNPTRKISAMKITFVALVLIAGTAILCAMVKIQWVNGKMWRAKAEEREHDIRTIPARRGNIHSSDGNILASTVPVCDLYLDLGRWEKRGKDNKVVRESMVTDSTFTKKHFGEVCTLLHEATPSKSAAYYHNLIITEWRSESPRRCFAVARNIPYSYWAKICQVPGWKRVVVRTKDGESVVHEVRAHPYGNLAGNVIGFYNGDNIRTYTGLEGYYDSLLRGQDGKIYCRRLTRGTWLPDEKSWRFGMSADDSMNVQKPVIDGCDIVSTIDTRYQDIAEHSLRDMLVKYNAHAGCAILMEIETGYILACSNLSLDTNTHTFREMPNRNVACSDIYEPGSTFKSVILTAMMNDTNISPNERVRVRQKVFPGVTLSGTPNEIKDDHEVTDSNGRVLDTLDVRSVIAHSSNVGMCELGWKYYGSQRSRLKNAVVKVFPFEPLHTDLRTAEYNSRINKLSTSPRDFLNFCYGYSTAVSALQVLTFYNAIGGQGRMVKPLFCKEIINGRHHQVIQPVLLKDKPICSKDVAAKMTDMLVGVVENGTGNNIKNSTYRIAGKTGTAKNYRTGRYNASFAGFFPAENPKYSCIVVAQDIPIYGRQAAEVFRDIASCVMAMDKSLGNISLEQKTKQLKKQQSQRQPYVTKGRQDEILHAYQLLNLPYHSTDSSSYWTIYGTDIAGHAESARYCGYQVPRNTVPNCMGMTIKDAVEMLRAMGLKVRFDGCGKVVSQSPKARTRCEKGATVYLTLGN